MQKASDQPQVPSLSAQEARQLLQIDDPHYGADFTESDWQVIAHSLSRLVRLLCDLRLGRLRRKEDRTRDAGSAPDQPPH